MDRTRQELLDKQAICEVVLTYCRGIDRLDFDLVRSAYHPDAIDHHTGFDGNIEEYIAWVTPKLTAIGGTMHHIGNHLVELHGDDAISEAYSTATHWGGGDGIGMINFTNGARPLTRWSDATGGGRSRNDGPYESGPARTRAASSTPKGLVRVGVVTPRIL